MMDWIVCSNLWNCYSIHARICIKKKSPPFYRSRDFLQKLYHQDSTVSLHRSGNAYIYNPGTAPQAHLDTGFSSFPYIYIDDSEDSRYLRFSQEVYGSPVHPAQCQHQIPPPPYLPMHHPLLPQKPSPAKSLLFKKLPDHKIQSACRGKGHLRILSQLFYGH